MQIWRQNGKTDQPRLRANAVMQACLAVLAALVSEAAIAQAQTSDPADLEVRKSVDVVTPSDPMQPVEFLVEIEHTYGAPAEDVVVEDLLPPELVIPEALAAFPSTGDYDPVTGLWQVGPMEQGDIQTLAVPALVAVEPMPECVFNVASLVGEDGSRQNNVGVAALKRSELETCVELEVLPEYADKEYCGNEGRVNFILSIRNLGPDSPVGMRVTLEEISDFKLPGFKFSPTSSRCTGLECGALLSTGAYWQAQANSKQFNNKTEQTHRLRITINTPDSGPEGEANIRTLTVEQVIPAFSRPCTDDFGGSKSSGGGCFIATAAYGTAMDKRIGVLRHFRDRHLAHWPGGETLIGWYYQYSPPIADYIAPRPALRGTVRVLLAPLVYMLTYPWYTLAGLVLFLSVVCRVRVSRTRRLRRAADR